MFIVRQRKRSSAPGHSGNSRTVIKSSENKSSRALYGASPDFVDFIARSMRKFTTSVAHFAASALHFWHCRMNLHISLICLKFQKQRQVTSSLYRASVSGSSETLCNEENSSFRVSKEPAVCTSRRIKAVTS